MILKSIRRTGALVNKDGKVSRRENGNGADRDRKRTILRAAVNVFATKGYHGCRIADVAKEAGVAYGLVYHYFKNKDALLQAVLHLGLDSLSGELRSLAESAGTFEVKLRRAVTFCFDAFRADPRLVRVLILQIARGPSLVGLNRYQAFGEIIQSFVELFKQGQRKGELRADIDPLLAAATLFGMVEMGLTAFVVGLYDAQDDAILGRAKKQVAETFLNGVLPPSGAEPWKAEKPPRNRAARQA